MYDSYTNLLVGALAISFLIIAVILILNTIGLWKLFKKAGRKGWESLIPFYNTWVLGEISGVAAWWPIIVILSGLSIFGKGSLGSLLRLASLFASFIIYYNLSKKLHKDTLTAVLLTIFSPIMLLVVGLSKNYQYDATVPVSQNGPFGSENNNSTVNNQTTTSQTATNDGSIKKYCTSCGAEINSNSKFCNNCGNEVK